MLSERQHDIAGLGTGARDLFGNGGVCLCFVSADDAAKPDGSGSLPPCRRSKKPIFDERIQLKQFLLAPWIRIDSPLTMSELAVAIGMTKPTDRYMKLDRQFIMDATNVNDHLQDGRFARTPSIANGNGCFLPGR